MIGARGHTGGELVRLLGAHPHLELALAASRELEGQAVPGAPDGLEYTSPGPGALDALDAVFLALPNGLSAPYEAAAGPDTVVVDISADHRFDDEWVYGLPELGREEIKGARRVANPGCYATVAQLAVAPFSDRLSATPVVFGVSGYSGAGTVPSARNDVDRLRDNLIPYHLTGHTHEREATRNLGHPIRFVPHVHPAFRGLLVTAHLPLAEPMARPEAGELVRSRYRAEELVEVIDGIPELKDGTGRPGAIIGGVDVSEDGQSAVVVAVEDNLLKGAAVQAVQNLNIAMGFPELAGIRES